MKTSLAVALALAGCSRSTTPVGGIPSDPEAGPSTTSATSTFAIDEVFLGDTTRDGTTSLTAWQSYGFDLDGFDTTATSTDTCILQPSTPATYQADGPGGIDNAWGATVMPILETAISEPHASNDATSAITRGDWTLLVQVDGLADDTLQNADGLHARVFVGAPTTTPGFDDATDWPMRPGEPVHFSDVYVVEGTVVARDADAPIVIPLELGIFGGTPAPAIVLPLVVRDPILTFAHASPGAAENGTLAGVLDADAFVAAVHAFAGRVSISLCGNAFDGIEAQLRECEDILADGSNGAGAPCSGISLGIGFRGKRVANPTTFGADPVPPVDPCADAGAD